MADILDFYMVLDNDNYIRKVDRKPAKNKAKSETEIAREKEITINYINEYFNKKNLTLYTRKEKSLDDYNSVIVDNSNKNFILFDSGRNPNIKGNLKDKPLLAELLQSQYVVVDYLNGKEFKYILRQITTSVSYNVRKLPANIIKYFLSLLNVSNKTDISTVIKASLSRNTIFKYYKPDYITDETKDDKNSFYLNIYNSSKSLIQSDYKVDGFDLSGIRINLKTNKDYAYILENPKSVQLICRSNRKNSKLTPLKTYSILEVRPTSKRMHDTIILVEDVITKEKINARLKNFKIKSNA